jgi:hypothetical protein
MKIIYRSLFFFLLVICFSCEKLPYYLVNCDGNNCTANKPFNTELEIKLEKSGNLVLIEIYEGLLEDNTIYDSFSTRFSSATCTVALNKTYTITATYFYAEGTYVSVNSVTPSVRYVRDICEDPCYHVYDKVVNLKLKYTK